jgi:DnaJ family protein B protein 4
MKLIYLYCLLLVWGELLYALRCDPKYYIHIGKCLPSLVPRKYHLALRGGAQSYYDILDLKTGPASTPDEVKRAYKKAALRWHPDRVPPAKKKEAEARFKKISEAYEILSDPSKKDFYDRYGDEGIRAQRNPSQPTGGGHGGGFPGGFPDGFAGGPGPGFYADGFPFAGAGAGPDFVFTDPLDLFARLFGDQLAAGAGAGRRRRHSGGLHTDLFGRTVLSGPGFEFTLGQPSLVHLGLQVASQVLSNWAHSRARAHADAGGADADADDDGPPPRHRRREVPLECTLEELAAGGTRKVRLGPGEPDLAVEVQPGWRAGTRITFMLPSAAGRARAEEVSVVVRELPHPSLTRHPHPPARTRRPAPAGPHPPAQSDSDSTVSPCSWPAFAGPVRARGALARMTPYPVTQTARIRMVRLTRIDSD